MESEDLPPWTWGPREKTEPLPKRRAVSLKDWGFREEEEPPRSAGQPAGRSGNTSKRPHQAMAVKPSQLVQAPEDLCYPSAG